MFNTRNHSQMIITQQRDTDNMHVLGSKKIFIVEDDTMNMVVYGALLRNTGATVIQDLWTTDSINMMLRKLPIDVILMDLMLRYGNTGYDIFQTIQKYPELRNIPVIAVSAADPGIEIPKARDMGFAGFIGKPINPVKFPEQILSCVQGEPVWYAQNGYAER